jgi:FHA domain
VLGPGARRHRLARTLNAAYAEGLLSERTLTHRLDLLFASSVIDPVGLVGDLTRRVPRRHRRRRRRQDDGGTLLALDWSGAQEELVIGRHPACDVVVSHPTVSRRHARLTFRDGGWTLQDLESTNGTRLNGKRVGRCRLAPGDQLALGEQSLRVD